MAAKRRTASIQVPPAPPRFKVADIVILDTAACHLIGRRWRVREITGDTYQLDPESPGSAGLRDVPFDMAVAPDETPKASIWLDKGTIVRYDGRTGYPGFMVQGDFGVILSDGPRKKDGEMCASVAKLGGYDAGFDSLTLRDVPHRHLTVVPVTAQLHEALARSAAEVTGGV